MYSFDYKCLSALLTTSKYSVSAPFFLTPTCPYTANIYESYINSPNYPEDYPHSSDCSWIFKPQSNQTLVLKVVVFDVDDEANDCYNSDHVEITWTAKETTGKVRKTKQFCNKNKNSVWEPIVSHGGDVKVSFKSTNWNQYKGFKIDYKLYDIGKLYWR